MYGLPIYNVERIIQQNNALFNDKEHIVYVNGAYRQDDEIGRLMQDFHCMDYRKIKNKPLADAVRYYKEDPKGVSEMCEAMDKISEKRAEEAVLKNKVETAEKMIKANLDAKQIADFTGLQLLQVEELKKGIPT